MFLTNIMFNTVLQYCLRSYICWWTISIRW